MSTIDTNEKPLIIDGVNVSKYDEEDLLDSDDIESMIEEEE